MMRSALTLTLLLFATIFNPGLHDAGLGQDENWKRRNDRGNRYEGLVSVSVGNPDLEVLSFTGFFEHFNSNVVLKVRFFLPNDSNLSISAQEIEDQRQYWMEAKPRAWNSGSWNEFSPWPTGDVILKEGIPADNLGVLIKLNGQDQLVPAFTYHSRVPDRVGGYTMHLRSNKNLRRVRVTLSGVGGNSKSIMRSQDMGRQAANVPFQVGLDVQGFKEGIIRVVIERELTDRPQPMPVREYRFYHKPEIR